MRRLLLVGEDYGYSEERYHYARYALTGASGERLASLAGLTLLELCARTARVNVVEYPDDWKDEAKVSRGTALASSLAIELSLPTIFLGERVARAMGVSLVPLFEWRQGRFPFARAPHPSGRNRFWNAPANVTRASAFFKDALRG